MHTPGPWQIEGITSVRRGEDLIALVYAPLEGMANWTDHHNANMALIAAAPDLLAACKMFLAEHDNTYDGAPMSQALYEAIVAMERAVEKAGTFA